MNLEWITSPLTMYGVLASGGVAFLYLVISTKVELRRQQNLHQSQIETLHEIIAALQVDVQKVVVDLKETVVSPAVYTPFQGLNVHKRAEALRMYRRGNDRHTISTALSLPLAEVALLEKVYHLLSSEAAA